ncbi:hypothetical protein EXU34_18065 [Alteromonas sp. ZYF713]|nr:hypothetical protein [Alteromonas sp. ZYF713]
MTVLLTLSDTPVWQAIVANSKFTKVKKFTDSAIGKENVCFEDNVHLADLKELISLTSDIVLCYESPEESLARGFLRNRNVTDSINYHISLYSDLLDIHRKSRRQMSLINLSQVAINGLDSTFQDQKLGFSTELTVSKCPDITGASRLIAQKAIDQHEELDTLCKSLQASSISGALNYPIFDISELVIKQYTQNEYKESLEKANQSIQLEYENCKARLDDLNTEQEILHRTIVDLQDRLESDNQRFSELQQQLQMVQNEAQQSVSQNRDLSAERNILLNNLNSIQIDLETKQQRLIEQDEQVVELQQQLEIFISENAELQAERELLNKSVSSLQDEVQLKQSVVAELEQGLRNSKVTESYIRQSFEQQLSESYAEKELVEERVNILADESVKLESALQDIERLNHELKDTHSAKIFYEDKVKELLSVVDKSSTEISKLNNKLNVLDDELTRLKDEKAKIKTKGLRDTKRLKREVSQLESKYEKIMRELLSTTDKLQYTEYELNKIKCSATWKLGAPARAVSKKLRKDDKDNEILKQNIGLLYTSDLFDVDWYLSSYPDIHEAGMDPAEHYLVHGAKEGRFPSAAFDGDWYLRTNPDVAESGMNPLIHFIKYGMAEGRMASPKLLSKD